MAVDGHAVARLEGLDVDSAPARGAADMAGANIGEDLEALGLIILLDVDRDVFGRLQSCCLHATLLALRDAV